MSKKTSAARSGPEWRHKMHIILHAHSLLVVMQYVTVMNIN